MLRFLIIFLAGFYLAFAGEYYAKIEPIETYDIKSAAQGEVVTAKRGLEGTVGQDGAIVQLDSSLDEATLKNQKTLLQLLRSRIALQKKISDIHNDNYQKIRSLKSKSQTQKDDFLVAAVSSDIALNQLQEQLVRTRITIGELEKNIENKNIKAKNLYIYRIYPSIGDYLRVGDNVATLMDISKAKAVLFLTKEDAQNLKNLSIYIDGKKMVQGFSKVLKVTDAQNISAYRAEIELEAPKRFSEVIKIELK